MTGELFVSVGPGEIRAGLFRDGEAIDLLIERDDRETLVGAIYLGRVIRVLPALPGAFVEIGLGRPAFLPGIVRHTEGAAIAVQIRKDAHGDKAPEVATALELAGRHGVWTPYRPGLSLSRQIGAAHRGALRAAVAPLIREGEGLLLRSEAEGADPIILAREIEQLRQAYAQIRRNMRAAESPARLDSVQDPLDRIVEACLGQAERIAIDDRLALARLRGRYELDVEFLASGADRLAALDEAFAAAIEPLVPLPGGGRLMIESGTACTLVDVDLGSGAGGREAAADAIRRVNLAAARTLGRELRRRNIGGAVVVDFITMSPRQHRQDVEALLAAEVAGDPAGVDLHGWTRLGHFELSRRRRRPSLAEILLEPAGARRLKTSFTIGLDVLRAFARTDYVPGGVRALIHPSIEAVLRSRLARQLAETEDRAGQRLTIVTETGRDPETFDIVPG
jgi:Rne/Rng family ribonuclease